MLRQHERKLKATLAVLDGLIAAIAFLLALLIRDSEPFRQAFELGEVARLDAIRAAGLAMVVFTTVLWYTGAYESNRRDRLRRVLARLVTASLFSLGTLMAAAFALRMDSLSRAVVGMGTLGSFAGMTVLRIVPLLVLRELRRRGYNYRTVLFIGTNPRAQRMAARIARRPEWGLRILGFLDDDPPDRFLQTLGADYLGPIARLSDALGREPIDEVVIALPRGLLGSESISNAVAVCEMAGVDVTLAADLFETRSARARLHELLGVPSITLATRQHQPVWALFVKRVLDLLIAAAGVLVMLPVWAVIAILIKLDSPGPIFYVQPRSGIGGRTFPFLKFRTMYRDSEERLAELRRQNEASGPVFKIKDDPRITSIGRFLRKYSIDELPQLLNVLSGHMSLVGPRPPIPAEVEQYEIEQHRRLSMRPGLTCLWQVAGRTRIPFEDWVRLDLQYIDEWSLMLDFQILAATIPAVLKGEGAS
jgi:exopolysaccharide biosynthesis polyprenyl glycosylphosphotransferase